MFCIIIAGLGCMFESLVYVFYELKTSHCVENPSCCWVFFGIQIVTFNDIPLCDLILLIKDSLTLS